MTLAECALVAKAVEEVHRALTTADPYGVQQSVTCTLNKDEARALLAWITEHDR